MDNKFETSQKSRATRIRAIRSKLGLSRRAFTETFGIATGTLQHWENIEDKTGLTEKGANTLSKALNSLNVQVTPEWLLHGLGSPPEMNSPSDTTTLIPTPVNSSNAKESSDKINHELQTFYAQNMNAIHYQLKDDGMLPLYGPNDYVAGVKHFKEDIETIVGLNCIIMTEHNDVWIRKVTQSNIPGLYTLRSVNPDSKTEKPTIYDVKLIYAAPILWIRYTHPK